VSRGGRGVVNIPNPFSEVFISGQQTQSWPRQHHEMQNCQTHFLHPMNLAHLAWVWLTDQAE
jgi:hypothetical protein